MAIIVGDIHGNAEKVKAFLSYKPEAVHVALGDYVDSFREPQERQLEALQMLIDSDAVLLWGNHDLMYLNKRPFICSGYQGSKTPFTPLIEANLDRFRSAYAVDGWLCTHAGLHDRLSVSRHTTDVYEIAAKINNQVAYLFTRQKSIFAKSSLFAIGKSRGGLRSRGGIFWHDFRQDYGLDTSIKQIFGHTEIPEPVVTDTYVALDTTNNRQYCWLYDTSINELVRLDLPKRKVGEV